MSDSYVDVRALHPDYEERRCPDCGTVEWFKHLDRPEWATDQWNCQACGSYYADVLEYPCPDCGIRMVREVGGDTLECRSVVCGEGAVDIGGLARRLASDDYPSMSHKPGVLMGECPLCESERGVNGGPDGELECDDCGEFYAGQYTEPWYCYAVWMDNPEAIRVNPP